jgi:preprotein translocase subunit SecE
VLRILAVIGGLAAGAAVAWWSQPGREFAVFAAESVGEVKKVVWPTRKETIQTTAAVFAFVVVMAVFLWISDKTLEWLLYDLTLGWRK